jgi:hypothetical protein
MPPDIPSPELDEFKQQVAALAANDHWANYRTHAGVGTHLLADLILILPKFGPLGDLSIYGPTPSAEQNYVKSLMHTADALRKSLSEATHSGGLPNKDLDTGDEVYPGTYSLEDYAYANLLHQMSSDPSQPIPFGIKRDLLTYFSDMSKVKYVQSNPKLLAQVQADLPVLKTISTKAEYPPSAFLPEPDEDTPEGTPAVPSQPATSVPIAPNPGS